jgi:hypothetical protein
MRKRSKAIESSEALLGTMTSMPYQLNGNRENEPLRVQYLPLLLLAPCIPGLGYDEH